MHALSRFDTRFRFPNRLITKGCHEAHSRRAGDDVIGSMRSSSPSSLRPESAAGRTKLLHDLFRSVIASVSSCRPGAAHPIHPASQPARAASWYRPEAALLENSLRLPSVSMSRGVIFLRRKIYEGRENTTGRCFSTTKRIANAKLCSHFCAKTREHNGATTIIQRCWWCGQLVQHKYSYYSR